uniref:Odorant receptor n=1 Tax=Glyphodes pyloalis TaxID=1242752 RepID=A0A6M3GU52_GLYPY|nr:olfactory receptor [Glyphodes pyloalis]
MIKQFLQSLEDPKKPLFGPNFWLLKKLGYILPENPLGKYIYIILHEIVAFFVLTQYMELYIIRSNLNLVLTNLQISMLSVVCVVKSNTFLFWQKSWRELIDYITTADCFERTSNDPNRRNILNKYTRYCRQMTFNYWGLLVITFITTSGTPLMQFLSSATYREKLRNGTELFPHIFSSWMPFDKYHSPGCWITVAWHLPLCAYGALTMSAYDSSIMVIMVFFGGKLDLLRERCKKMLGTDGVPISDDEAAVNIQELHQTHVDIMKYSRLFNSMLSPVMFLYIVLCSLMLCATAYQLTSDTNAAQKLLLAEYLLFGIAQLSIFCWHSNDVLVKYQNVMMGPYESQWWAASVTQRKSVLMLVGQLRISKVFTAGPFTNLTLSTFLAILKGAYSYYTLLRN